MTYDTSPDQMEKTMSILKDIAEKEKDVNKDYNVRFNAFGYLALGIVFIYQIKKGSNILQVQNDVNLKILREFNNNWINMAFPTQTIELKK